MAALTHAQRVNSNRLVEEYFDSLMIRYRYIGNVEASTAFSLYGESFRTPILCGPLAYRALDQIHESGRLGLARGLDDAGSAMISAWIGDDELKAMVDAGFRVARSIKLFEDHDRVLQIIEASEKIGAFAVCMDIDHIFDEQGNYCPWAEGQLGRHTVEDFKAYVSATKLPVILKGVLSPMDAQSCVEAGVGGIILSNHNNRFPSAVPPLAVLPEIKRIVDGRFPVLVDGCIVSGVEAFKALALGADGVLASRVFMTAFAKGPEGVTQKLNDMTAELKCCMSNTGAASLAEIPADSLVQRTW